MSDYSYFASQSFGLYRCADWKYDSSIPTWIHTGQETAISEFALDLNDPDEFQACRSGASIYVRRPTHYGDDDWHEVYSVTQAETQFGENFADFRWIEINSAPGKEGHMYCQCIEAYNASGKDLWLMKSVDYGGAWSRHLIMSGIFRAPGGVWAGRVTGDVMYASYSGHGLITNCHVRYSIDEGGTWAAKQVLGGAIWVSRVLIDPTDEGITFMGYPIDGPDLYRATAVGGGVALVEEGAGICIFYGYGGGWVSAWNGNYVRTIRVNTLHYSDTSGDPLTWGSNGVTDVGHGATFERAMWGEDKKPHWVGVASRTGISEPFINYHLLKSTQDNGGVWHDKAGANADTADTGGGDSIPYNCGGVAENGLYLMIPEGRVFTSVVAMRTLPTGGTVYADGVQVGTIADGSTVYAHGVEQENPRP